MKTFEEVIASNAININEFESFRLAQMEIEKQKINKILLITGISFVVLSIALLIVGLWPALFFLLIIALIVFFVIRGNVKAVYVNTFKEGVLKSLVQSIAPEMNYAPKGFIKKETFKKSNFTSTGNRYGGEDYFYGIYNGIPVEFSELTVEQKNKNSSTVLFKGLFFQMTVIKSFAGRTAIVPDTMEKTFGSLGRFFQSMSFFRDKLIKVNNERFEKEFAIYSNNEQEAQAIFLPEFIEVIFNLKQESNGLIYISWNQNSLFLGFHNRHDIFQVNIKNPINEGMIRNYYTELSFYLNALSKIHTVVEGCRL